MSTLIAIIFENDPNGATTGLSRLQNLEKFYAIELGDSVIATRNENGSIFLKP